MNGRVALAILLTLSGAAVAVRGDNAPAAKSAGALDWPAGLPVYDHAVIVVEENKDCDQIIDNPDAPFINKTLRPAGANFTQMFGEEHNSQGNYFWLFSGSNQGVGFRDGVPAVPIRKTRNLGASLIEKGLSFKGYSEDLPAVGSEVLFAPTGETAGCPRYARKHVPWISFTNVPNGPTVAKSSNLRFADFPTGPAQFASLPTVAFVIPNLQNDMHDGAPEVSIPRGDKWLKENLGDYYQWAKTHNSLLIVTFDENLAATGEVGLTDPFVKSEEGASKQQQRAIKDRRNQIFTVFAGAHIKPGDYPEGKGITHVNILRTLEAMYGLPKAGAQQPHAAEGGITDDYIVTDVFEKAQK